MKQKLIRVALFVLTLTCTAFALKEEILTRIMAYQVKKRVTSEFVNKKLLGEYFRNKETFHFRYIHRDCREELFKGTLDYNESGSSYFAYRALLVSVLKTQLHSGTTLEDIYKLCRKDFQDLLSAETPEFRTRVIATLEKLAKLYKDAERPGFRTEFNKATRMASFKEEIQYWSFNHPMSVLQKNLSPEKTLELLKKGPRVPEAGMNLEGQDLELIEFVLRRQSEGGTELLRKYQKVISLALADAKAINGVIEK